MKPSAQNIAALIDHTLLRPEATRHEIIQVCREAREYRFASVCVNSYWVPMVAAELAGSSVKVCSVIGFPFGVITTEAKVAEAQAALRSGARELDMVQNVGALLSGDYDQVQADIDAVVQAAHDSAAIVKVILETGLLDDPQKTKACQLAKRAEADFVKTSTGFGPSGATTHDVRLMREAVGSKIGVKASGGIRTLERLEEMFAAGATRIGTSSGVRIMQTLAGAGQLTGGD